MEGRKENVWEKETCIQDKTTQITNDFNVQAEVRKF